MGKQNQILNFTPIFITSPIITIAIFSYPIKSTPYFQKNNRGLCVYNPNKTELNTLLAR